VIVTADGRVLDLSEPVVDPTGYDLVGLFVGSEGMFGIATEVTVRLLPVPPVVETFLAVFEDLDPACDSVTEMIAARLEPSAIEILDRLTIEAVESSVLAAGYPKAAGAVLLVEVEGAEVEVAEIARAVRAIVERHRPIEIRSARGAAERAQLWAGRKGAFGAMGRIAPDLYVADVVIRGRSSAGSCGARRRSAARSASGSRTCSTPATGTCTRTSATTGATRTRRGACSRPARRS
jgi:FAD/FMN-containing dehydrogenase